jgi:putative membrane protein
MTQDVKRYHPALIVVELVSFIKNSIGFSLFLFVFKSSSTSNWVMWGRYLLLIGEIIMSIVFKTASIYGTVHRTY